MGLIEHTLHVEGYAAEIVKTKYSRALYEVARPLEGYFKRIAIGGLHTHRE